jgi:hypothetical protein
MASKKRELDEKLQTLIERHGRDSPKLRADLEALRRDLLQPNLSARDMAAICLRVATWAKWIYDIL